MFVDHFSATFHKLSSNISVVIATDKKLKHRILVAAMFIAHYENMCEIKAVYF
jgi:hypothetical protein